MIADFEPLAIAWPPFQKHILQDDRIIMRLVMGAIDKGDGLLLR